VKVFVGVNSKRTRLVPGVSQWMGCSVMRCGLLDLFEYQIYLTKELTRLDQNLLLVFHHQLREKNCCY
jgi:hypothetical protein